MGTKYNEKFTTTDQLGGSDTFEVEAIQYDFRKYVSLDVSDGECAFIAGLTAEDANRLALALGEAAAALDDKPPAPLPPADETRATAIQEAIEALGLLDQVPYGEFAAAVGTVVERLKAVL
ncbi:hypothetical protein ACFORO_42665 [Amycolatopsis halotolerans]|uniref:Uncharacterized protein n=1 Tax=Amycolatopsis halotolerans TaxID=330083 RepID=A0ABV7QV15_9PSEU